MIIKTVVLMLLVFLNLSGISKAENIDARNNLLRKYNNEGEIYVPLRNILKPNLDSRNGINDFYNSFEKLKESKSIKSTELLVDLLDFYLGETPIEIITKALIEKGVSSLPLLRKKMIDSAIVDEMPNEHAIDVIAKKRNERIVFIIEHIYYQVPYEYEYSELDDISLTKVKLYNIQKYLENYFIENGEYPIDLMGLKKEKSNFELDLTIDAWNHTFRYKSGSKFYFLGSKGKDGLCDTQDDLFPPISTELHKFPPRNL